MKKELKDYLHFYLGCECKTPLGVMILTAVKVHEAYPAWFNCQYDKKKHKYLPEQNAEILTKAGIIGRGCRLNKIKPILRPLIDMTQSEAVSILKFDSDFHKDFNGWLTDFVKWEKYKVYKPFELANLISKHFDIFGLIESGLAIDKTTLKNKTK